MKGCTLSYYIKLYDAKSPIRAQRTDFRSHLVGFSRLWTAPIGWNAGQSAVANITLIYQEYGIWNMTGRFCRQI